MTVRRVRSRKRRVRSRKRWRRWPTPAHVVLEALLDAHGHQVVAHALDKYINEPLPERRRGAPNPERDRRIRAVVLLIEDPPFFSRTKAVEDIADRLDVEPETIWRAMSRADMCQ